MVVIGLGFKVKARKAGSRTLAKEDRGLQPYPNLRPWLKWVNGDNKDLHQQFRIIIFAIIKFINLKYGVMSTEENKTEMVYQVKVNVYCGYQVEDYMPNKPVLKFEDEIDLDIPDKLDEMVQTTPSKTMLFEVKESEVLPLIERLRDKSLELLTNADEGVDDDDYYDCIPDWYGQVMMVAFQLIHRNHGYDDKSMEILNPVIELAKKVYPVKDEGCDLDGYLPRNYRGEVDLATLVLTLVKVYDKDQDLFDEL